MEKIRFLVIDTGGIHVDTARKLGQEGHTVYYYTPYQEVYPQFRRFAPGVGVPEIQKVYDYGKYLDEVDCIFFPYVGMGELAHYLRQKGYVVFGAGRGEEIEQDRPLSLQIMEKVGVKYPESHCVKGIDEAVAKLKSLLGQKNETNQNATGKYFVKFNIFRGEIDSFPAKSVDEAQFMFDSLRGSLGPYANQIPITIQKTVEGVETGADLFFNGDDFITPGMVGFESGDNYIGYITDDLSIFKNDLVRVGKYLRAVNYRGAFSFECIFDGHDNYWIDHTTRFPMPLGLMYPTFIQNFGQFILDVATGNAKTLPIEVGTYLSCMSVKSEEANTRYIPIQGGKNTKFMSYMMDGGKMYSVPGISSLGVVCAESDRYDQLEPNTAKESEELNVFFGDFNKKFAEDIRSKYIEPLKKLGVTFFGSDVTGGEEVKPAPKVVPESRELKEICDRWGVPKHLG